MKMIVAYDANNGIGKDNKLIWNNAEDLKRFKTLTSDAEVLPNVIMGRKTFESLPNILKNRTNIILSKDSYSIIIGEEMDIVNYDFTDKEKFKEFAEMYKDSWVIGGEEIYNAFLPYTNEIYATEIATSLEADKFFPRFDKNVFIERSRENKTGYDFVVYAKNI